MRVWAALPLLWGQPEPRQYAATTAPCQVEVCLFSSREDGDLTERASHEECGESSCRKGRHAPQYRQGFEHGKRELRCLIAEVDPRLPPALKPGAPFCCLGPACELFLGCGDGLWRAGVFCSAWEAETAWLFRAASAAQEASESLRERGQLGRPLAADTLEWPWELGRPPDSPRSSTGPRTPGHLWALFAPGMVLPSEFLSEKM